jgi:hypothetical protein
MHRIRLDVNPKAASAEISRFTDKDGETWLVVTDAIRELRRTSARGLRL